MTLIRALPPLTPHAPPASGRAQLQRLESLAQRELVALQASTPAALPSPDRDLASLAWDLGLSAEDLHR